MQLLTNTENAAAGLKKPHCGCPPHTHTLLHLAQCCFHLFSEHKVDAVLLLGLRKMRVSTAEALTTIYKMTPPHTPPSPLILSLALPLFMPPPSLSASS